jgi:hypothetical protein
MGIAGDKPRQWFFCLYDKKTKRTKKIKTRKRELLCKSKRARRLTVVLPPQA